MLLSPPLTLLHLTVTCALSPIDTVWHPPQHPAGKVEEGRADTQGPEQEVMRLVCQLRLDGLDRPDRLGHDLGLRYPLNHHRQHGGFLDTATGDQLAMMHQEDCTLST